MPHKAKRKTNIYQYPRYWYHISTTLTKKKETLFPRIEGFNRDEKEPPIKRICVAPSIEQCITAVPYRLGDEIDIYRTTKKVLAVKPNGIFDSAVTNEGWLVFPSDFVRVGRLNFETVEKKLKVENVIPQSASVNSPSYAGIVLKWWRKARIKRFIKSS